MRKLNGKIEISMWDYEYFRKCEKELEQFKAEENRKKFSIVIERLGIADMALKTIITDDLLIKQLSEDLAKSNISKDKLSEKYNACYSYRVNLEGKISEFKSMSIFQFLKWRKG